MSEASIVPVHSLHTVDIVEKAEKDPKTVSPQEHICLEMEIPKVYDITLKKKRNDPAALLRQKTYKLLNNFIDATPWAYALASAALFMVPLTQCIDIQCMVRHLPPSVCNLWYTQAVVIIAIIILNLLLAGLLCVKSVVVKLFCILSTTLLVFYYLLAFLLYSAIQPYDTHLALHVFVTTCAIALPSWILNRLMTKKPKVKVVYVTHV